ncbi:MAG: hypothetical protein ABS76_30630 [Pelagibacterium sp. SCN 64-44]|nr:MAG: hypothetical protein ABS76_30630 [Pelagibacterium sp. SCN 64-44]
MTTDPADSSPPRKRAPTIVDVAEAAGVAIGTVSRHINGLPVRATNRDQIERAIAALGYRRNATAVAMKTDMTHIVGFLVPSLSEFHAQILEQLTRKMRLRGRAVLSFCHEHQVALMREGLEFFASHRVDAIVMDGNEALRQDLQPFIDEDLVVVLYDNDMPGVVVDRVFVDNRGASERAVGHLLDLGHTRVATIHGALEDSAGRERLEGYQAAFRARGLEPDPILAIEGGWNESGGYHAVEQLAALANPPTAIFSANYNMTLGVLTYLHENDIRLPQDLSLIGFDDVAALRLHMPAVTAVGQPIDDLAETIADIVHRRLSNPSAMGRREVRLRAEVILRNSTGRPQQAGRED